MSEITIEKMKELEAKATPGPWYAESGYEGVVFLHSDTTHDAQFIAAARAFVPWAIAEIERLRKADEFLRLLIDSPVWHKFPESQPEAGRHFVYRRHDEDHPDHQEYRCGYFGSCLAPGEVSKYLEFNHSAEWMYFEPPEREVSMK
jgi:hypothetical protein